MRSLTEVLKDAGSKYLTDSERAVKFRNAKKFVSIFFKENPSMRLGLTKPETKAIIQKMMVVLSLRDINMKMDRDEANKSLTDNIRTIKENKRNRKDSSTKDDTEMIDAVDEEIEEGKETNMEDDDEKAVRNKEKDGRKEDAKEGKSGGKNRRPSALDALMASDRPRQARRTERTTVLPTVCLLYTSPSPRD